MKQFGPPKLWNVVCLRCIYCGTSPLLKPKTLFEFGEGCSRCNYRYEREVGYFAGASWMITYVVAALSAMVAGGLMVWKFSDQGDLVVAGVPAAIAGITALIFIPYGRAIWMYLDHMFHPLNEDDRIKGQNI